jgi:hypothetical protein
MGLSKTSTQPAATDPAAKTYKTSKYLAPVDSSPATAGLQDEMGTTVSEFGCLVLMLALNESVWAWRRQQYDREQPSRQIRRSCRSSNTPLMNVNLYGSASPNEGQLNIGDNLQAPPQLSPYFQP